MIAKSVPNPFTGVFDAVPPAMAQAAIPYVVIREPRCADCGAPNTQEVSLDHGFTFANRCPDCTTLAVNKARAREASALETHQ